MPRRRITLKPPSRIMGQTAGRFLARAGRRTEQARALASLCGRIMAEREQAILDREERVARRAERIRKMFSRHHSSP